MIIWPFMQLVDVFLKLGEDEFGQLIRTISIGKLKTYQIYDGFKTRAHVVKLNTETLRKAGPKFRTRLAGQDEDFAKDLAQAVLVSHLDMIIAVLDFLGIPHEGGFFGKETDVKPYLAGDWAERTWEHFRSVYPEPLLLFYINHLAWELTDRTEPFTSAALTR